MNAIATILCAVDGSEMSQRALHYATAIAVGHRARLHVLEVSEPESPEADPANLRRMAAPASAAGVLADVHVRQGHVPRQILREAGERHADLIVLGSRGRHGLERLVLGSVTTSILHSAPFPVLVVPPGADPVPERTFQTVLCPTDFSSAGNAAVNFARVLADPGESTTLILAHVVEWPFGDTAGEDPVSELRRSLESQGQEELEHLAATVSLVSPAPQIRTVVAAGKPSREICAIARTEHADLIAIGVTGRGAIDLAILGSTAHQILRQAPCPVVTVPHTVA